MDSEAPKIWSSFIRGFSDCDGSLNFGKRYGACQKILRIVHTYPRIQLKSVSHSLIKDISDLLGRLDIKHFTCSLRSLKENERDCSLTQISGKKRLEKWMDIIGFNNPVQQTKYEIFKKHGFVPVNTSLSQRKGILKGRISPWSFYPRRTRSLVWIRRQDNSVPLEPSKL